ncbi:MAG: type II toxin-antitoxin system RelE/ParE family toxin [Aquificales bacterium]|nr:type II toxin-antitoxin system RelE/ParE family toxin [Aquificales bacterium]
MLKNFDVLQPETLTGQWAGVNKLRVGDYRVLYTVVEEQHRIVIHVIRNRRDVYKT